MKKGYEECMAESIKAHKDAFKYIKSRKCAREAAG